MKVIDEYKSTRQQLFDAEGIQPQSIMVATNGPIKNVHYLKLGKGEPLILIHGGGSHSSEWINILKPLSEYFQLYVVDRPGCGLSDTISYHGLDFRKSVVDFVRSFLEAVGLERAMFLGQSMGGYFSICFALQYPGRVKKLALIGAPAGMNHWIPMPLRLLGLKGVNSLLMHTVAKPSIKNVANLHRQILVADVTKLSDTYLRHTYYHQCISANAHSFLSLLENVLTIKGWRKALYIGDQLDRLKMPVGFIWGNQDAFEKPKTGLKKAAAIQDYTFKVVQNAGHCPWLDQPEICTQHIITMFNQKENGRIIS
ncbi:alpha/beta fold hydrolase [Catalinimonas niigatensis]|uniref:alpha/beta fold hydrolase n=1 Tax=Catalinimonas niigatensis TaxID=1397264 RepID=UPI002664FBAE|nr:alpha/beta hydrolase [Catalinimonas niigatensis]WPP52678.1 alpha/beta hydrolase [Catalinimonas niigatensis]